MGWAVLIAVAATATGFDHFIHEGRVTGSGAAERTCVDCHARDEPPSHATCFGACHGDAPAKLRGRKKYAIDDARRSLCLTCHAPDDVAKAERGDARRLPVFYPPYTVESDYALTLSHAKHAVTGCETCHAATGTRRKRKPKPKPHARCTPCHQKPDAAGTPKMSDCAACHRSAFGPAVGPTLQRGALPVTAAFAHDKHLSRMAKRGARDCETCHAAVSATETEKVPSPTMAACATCHDGTRAFSTTGASCRKCHQFVKSTRPDRSPRTAFSHARHVDLDERFACADCHRFDADGRSRPTAPDHLPCATAECHASDFSAMKPKTCGACHVGNEPWRPLEWFPAAPARTEFGAPFSHAAHAEKRPECAACHGGAGAGRPVRGGHATCFGDGCHDGAAKPAFADCSGCHAAGAYAARLDAAAERRWSVRAKFRHDRHEAACAECHAGVASTTDLAAITAPPKPTCAPCHDGAKAFKMTGHGCARCHGTAR